MLFNSYAFLLAFLPLSLAVYHGLRHFGWERASILALVLLSLFFYAWWNPIYLLVIVPQMLATFVLARFIVLHAAQHRQMAKALLLLGIGGNLAVLAYFKYANFFVDSVDALLGLDFQLARIVLPLGISFFTFQKIAFLVDAYRGKVDRLELLDFSLFVTFFPQLIAGPITHHSEVLPQFRRCGRVAPEYVAMGVTIFVIGLAKKVLLADSVAEYATPGFDAAAHGAELGFFAAWSSALAYTAQLYFDFSGYSDMAIGAALLFGIRLPVNFDSPYRATSIIEFWRRWHMTLSRFLRDYLYVALGGNRHGKVRRYVNLMLTMLLGGLWHGAGWTFVVWGALHGLYLCINHAWRALHARLFGASATPGPLQNAAARVVTLLAVVIGWVFFRAADLDTAFAVLRGMAGWARPAAQPFDASVLAGAAWASALLLVAMLAPNTQQLVNYLAPGDTTRSAATRWRPSAAWALATGVTGAIALSLLSRVSEFLYFQF